MSARAMRAVDFPLLFGPTKTLMCASNSNVISSKGPTLVTRKSQIGINKSPEIAPPQYHNLFTLPLPTELAEAGNITGGKIVNAFVAPCHLERSQAVKP